MFTAQRKGSAEKYYGSLGAGWQRVELLTGEHIRSEGRANLSGFTSVTMGTEVLSGRRGHVPVHPYYWQTPTSMFAMGIAISHSSFLRESG